MFHDLQVACCVIRGRLDIPSSYSVGPTFQLTADLTAGSCFLPHSALQDFRSRHQRFLPRHVQFIIIHCDAIQPELITLSSDTEIQTCKSSPSSSVRVSNRNFRDCRFFLTLTVDVSKLPFRQVRCSGKCHRQ